MMLLHVVHVGTDDEVNMLLCMCGLAYMLV